MRRRHLALPLATLLLLAPARAAGSQEGGQDPGPAGDPGGAAERPGPGGDGNDDPQADPDAPAQPQLPIVRGVQVTGLVYRDPDVIARRLGIEVGKPIPAGPRVTALQKRLYDDFGIFVNAGGYTFEETLGGVIVHLDLYEQPFDLEPSFVGNKRFNTDQLREWAGLAQRAEVFTEEIESVESLLLAAYRRQGYHFVEIEHVVGGENAKSQEIIFQIREGPKVYVTDVRVEGNESFPDEGVLIWRKTLKGQAGVRTKGRGLFAWFGHRYDAEVVEADRIAISNAYRERGFLDVVVAAEVEFSRDRGGAVVTFRIDEGPRYSVASVKIRAQEVEQVQLVPNGLFEEEVRDAELLIPEEELLGILALTEGEPFEQSRVRIDRSRLLDRYGERGHIDAFSFEGKSGTAGWRWLGTDIVRDYENKEVHVTYRIQQGRPFRLRTLDVAGNLDTKDRVIRRLISQLPGELINNKKLREDRARLERTQYFSDTFSPGTHPPPSFSFRTVEGEPDLVDIVATVKEGRTINANLSGGVASDQGLVGLVSLTINNFDAQRLPRSIFGAFGEVYRKEAWTGDGETLGFDLSPGSEVNYSRIFYQHPDIFGRHFDAIGASGEYQLRDRLFRSHDERRQFVRLSMTRAFGQGDVRASVGVRFQELRTDNLDPAETIPRTLLNSQGDEQFVGVTGSLSINKLDNTRLPRRGFTGRLSTTVYGESFGSDNNLWKLEGSYDHYFHLASDNLTAAPGIYMGLGAGLAVPFDDSRGTVNYGERYFFGGARIGRGFRFRGIGPYDGQFPLGGETYLRSTFEYRFPLYTQSVPGSSRRREVFRGSLFLDTVILDPDAYELDLEEARVSAGFALGLIEPFPVTFSFGWPLRSEATDERQVFAFSLTFR